ncbi:uncharacterized protein LOC107999827 [Apis cerana]|uniref:Protein G12 n=1 Tax=Apis cerana cerana TaxID=94128 RepID=A0A2A3E602_APICC|nr:uncharacterized protein LOC107999827 [Apis cerana]PBC26914.1 hypothetical protein APICC_01065 [Apis cerana cerana]
MMKFALVILVALAVSNPLEAYKVPSIGSGALANELQKFIDLIPLEKINAIISVYKKEDAEFQELLKYLQSSEFKLLVAEIEGFPEFIDILNYEQRAGLDAYYLVNEVNEYLHLSKLTPPFSRAKTSGIRGFLDEVEALIPLDKLKNLYQDRLKNSAVFAEFINKLKSPTAQSLLNKLCASKNFNNFLSKAKSHGVHLDVVKKHLKNVLGLNAPCIN